MMASVMPSQIHIDRNSQSSLCSRPTLPYDEVQIHKLFLQIMIFKNYNKAYRVVKDTNSVKILLSITCEFTLFVSSLYFFITILNSKLVSSRYFFIAILNSKLSWQDSDNSSILRYFNNLNLV